ncbi:peroxisomal membrane protein 4 isoform X3 [Canis lupus baileyi]|uniref:Peroxisomal membrane protein 4 n=1 Tax=Canis lupus familiaris TaxID=9615 RepID=A0A8P0PFH8_CANLF|nr:peroxisomal membrane protein 4 isoform X3 [Canis lupus familiaris]XP_025865664.1 peroxisomal membrane protein 4 isoform X2 [Vulpes vulpes]XP_038427962.1 peroxisomal membrane protein 4 isoform X3 [Canis lupus familiaris]|eukprot:XP_005635003.1 peroxisomal membrane protein 4 isoform X2 [Canis lupus familiaris]
MAVPPQLPALLHAVNALLRKRRYHAALAMLKGFRNGAVYGAKIRAPHALVMTFLFRSGRSTCTCSHESCLLYAAWAWRRATFLNPGGTYSVCSPQSCGGWCCGSLSTIGPLCSPHCSPP